MNLYIYLFIFCKKKNKKNNKKKKQKNCEAAFFLFSFLGHFMHQHAPKTPVWVYFVFWQFEWYDIVKIRSGIFKITNTWDSM